MGIKVELVYALNDIIKKITDINTEIDNSAHEKAKIDIQNTERRIFLEELEEIRFNLKEIIDKIETPD